MTEFWHELTANLAVLAITFAAWAIALERLSGHGRRSRDAALGLFMGLGAVTSMIFAIEVHPGMILDLRAVPLTVAGLFGGPIAALIACGIAVACRLMLGGAGAWPGAGVIGVTTLVGLSAYLISAGRPKLPVVLAVAAGTAAVPSLVLWAMGRPEGAVMTDYAVTMGLVAFCATAAAGFVIRRAQMTADERDLLQMALRQAPDFHYVKDRASVIVAANESVARYNGFARASDVVGKTDFDLTDAKRAGELFEAEQNIMRTGVPLIDNVEHMPNKQGSERWFLTSKVALHNADGETIGLAGVTRDITEHHRMETALADSRNLLNYAVEGMSDGLAMFDRDGYLVYCNERYRTHFPLTGDIRQPGVNIRDILRRVVETGEQLDLGDAEAWLQNIAGSLNRDSEEQVRLFDGRWLHVRTRPTEQGAAMVVVADVTSFKQAEGELRTLTSQLRHLADTDGLTGLMNRRSFDARLAEELERSEREQRPLSVVLFDVDYFKAYNDTLGHLAGDKCLKHVARVVRTALLRQQDVAARYGGEEFIAILPDTDEDSAFQIAERARLGLLELRLPHSTVKGGVVTMSAGIATYARSAAPRGARQLLSRADEALYAAKAAGRNRVMGWRPSDTAQIAG